MGSDLQRTQGFNGEVLGWRFCPGPGGKPYGVVEGASAPGAGVGQGPRSWTTFYVGVDDLAATLERATRSGGSVLMPPMELPDVTVAVVADPDGNALGLAQSKAG